MSNTAPDIDKTAERVSQRLERLEELINRLTVVNFHNTH